LRSRFLSAFLSLSNERIGKDTTRTQDFNKTKYLFLFA
jgi:hypothetical protein